MTIPTYQGAATLLPAVQRCLEANLPTVLAAASSGLGFTLDDVRKFWRGERIPSDANTPGVGVWIEQSANRSPSGFNGYDTDHTVVLSLLTSSANASAGTLSEYTDAVHGYAEALAYTLNRYFTGAGSEGAAVGAYEVETLDTTPIPLDEVDQGQFNTHTTIRLRVRQRMPRWES